MPSHPAAGARRGTPAPSRGRPRPPGVYVGCIAREVTRRSFRRTAPEQRRARRPTAAAPTSGPSAPRPPGTTVGRRRYSSRGVAIELGLRGGEERLAEAEGDRAGDDGETEVEQGRHRRDAPGRRSEPGARRSSRATPRLGRAARDRCDRRCPTLGLEATPAPHRHTDDRRARRRRGRCARRCRRRRRAGGRRARCRRRPRSTRPCRGSRARPRAAPRQPSASASALASLSTDGRQPGALRDATPQRESAPRRMFSGDTVLAARRHRSAATDATRNGTMSTVAAALRRRRAPARRGRTARPHRAPAGRWLVAATAPRRRR